MVRRLPVAKAAAFLLGVALAGLLAASVFWPVRVVKDWRHLRARAVGIYNRSLEAARP